MADMTLEEALEAATVDEELVTPVNEVLMINPETRSINVPDSEKMFGVRQDMSVERKYFKCPRIVGDNIDLFEHYVFVNYIPSDQNGKYESEKDVQGYWCKDLAVEGDFITFSWELTENVLRKAGYIAFAVYAKVSDENGNLKTKWHTTIAIGNVLDTLPDGEEWITIYPDIVTQLLERMDAVEKIANPESMQEYVDDYFNRNPMMIDRELKDSTKAAPADIVGKLSEDIATKASAIKEKASGETIVVTDSDEAKPLGLAIDGKSEQDGEPTPDNPIEIVNVGKYDEASGKYAVEVKSNGKNLLKSTATKQEINGGTVTVNEDKSVTVNGTFNADTNIIICYAPKLTVGQKYILNGCPSGGSTSTYYLQYSNYTDKTYNDVGNGVEIDAFDLETYPNTRVRLNIKAGITVSNLEFKPMISTNGGEYEPYKETTATVLLDEPLRKGDKAYWNGGSKVRVDRNAIYARITSDLSWTFSATTNRFYANDNRFKKGVSGAVKPNALCNMFVLANQNDSNTDLMFNSISPNINGYAFRYLALNGDIEAWKQFLDENEVYVCGEANTPTTEEIDINLDEISMFYPTTILSNDCNANMEVTYIADTKAYIDKKFAELATAMV